jgi:hypothetical protein
MSARMAASSSGLVVLVGYPLLCLVARGTHVASGDLDLSDAWAWPPLVVAALATSAAVFFWRLRRDESTAGREVFVHESFEYHDAMLQNVVAARMALELDEVGRAGAMLDTVIESASDVVTSLVTTDERAQLSRSG